MEIKGFIPSSMLEWEGKLSCVIFLPGCNLRCGFCHAADLVLHPERLETVPLETVLDHVRANTGWLDGAVITGGEPTLCDDELLELARILKNAGLEVMVETNGTRPDVIEKLMRQGLADACEALGVPVASAAERAAAVYAGQCVDTQEKRQDQLACISRPGHVVG